MPAKPKLAVDLMLDSGAYSAWTKDQPISLKKYMRYIKRNIDYLFSYVNLDVLPTGAESKRTDEAIEVAAGESMENYKRMLDAGLQPIPVFHQGERFEWLEQLVDMGAQYIGLSTRKDLLVFERMQREWLDKCFSILPKGMKTHGFGITKIEYLKRYPFYTVDSTRWALVGAYGNILVPPCDAEGKWDYSKKAIEVHVTDAPRLNRLDSSNKHFDLLSTAMQDRVIDYVNNVLKLQMHDVRYWSDARRRATLIYFTNFAKTLPAKTRIMYATTFGNRQFAKLLQDVGARDQLFSYFELQDRDDDVLQEYVINGMLKGRGSKRLPINWKRESYLNVRRASLIKRTEDPYVEA